MSLCDNCRRPSVGCLVFHAIRDGSFLGAALAVCADCKVTAKHPVADGVVSFVGNEWKRREAPQCPC